LTTLTRSLSWELPVFWRRRPPTGDALVDRLRDGQLAAVGEAYELHGAVVAAFARRLVGDADAAQDLVQEVFVTLPKVASRIDGRSSLRTFLMGIAVNHSRHHLRAAMRRRRAWQRQAEEPQRWVPDPERGASDRQLAEALERALDALPHDQRVAFVLCEVEERTSVEAAEITGAPEATMRTRLFHAKRKLRELLTAEGIR
jgi:RNA polymerase sigma-70 factor (ECF subfamily)